MSKPLIQSNILRLGLVAATAIGVGLHSRAIGQVIIDDSFEDADRESWGPMEAYWWSSNSTSANSLEIYEGQLGLVSGTSGRGIHGTFEPQTLDVGEALTATLTFTTPATVGSDRGTAFKFALMDLNDFDLEADQLSNSSSVNPLYQELPGYMVDFDVNNGTDANTTIRKHDVPNDSGRFLGTTSEWTRIGGSTEGGYSFAPETEYTVSISVHRTGQDTLSISAVLKQGDTQLDGHSESDSSGIANNFGMLGVWVNSNTFGAHTVPAEGEDNGITFSNIKVERGDPLQLGTNAPNEPSEPGEPSNPVEPAPPSEPALASAEDTFADGDRASTGPEQADWWSSNSTSGNSVEAYPGQLGLISGTSGRGIHGTISPYVLEIGETLTTTLAFTTPATVGTDRGSAFKIALMDFNSAGLAADLSSSSQSVNPLYTDLPGYLVDFDVNTGEEADITIRKHNDPNDVGRFLGTTSEWSTIGSSEDAGYSFTPDTDYVAILSLTRTDEDNLRISASLSEGERVLDSHTETDFEDIANNFGVLGIWANSNTFGSTNARGETEDNGITLTSVKFERTGEMTDDPGASPLIVDDSFTDGLRVATGGLEAEWWSSNSTSGNSVEVYGGQLGLVTGTSGRGIHSTFNPRTLIIGDTLQASLTFTTPETVGTDRGSAFKFALMDLNDPALAADLSSSSQGVNPLYTNLPGYLVDFDVNTGEEADTNIRKHDSPNEVGRFLGTTSEWSGLGSSSDAGYAFEANTEYAVTLSITRTGDDTADISGSLSQGGTILDSHTETDESDIANNFGMLGIWVNSNTFGSTNSQGESEDNGITFSNVRVEVLGTPAAPPTLAIQFADNMVEISWPSTDGSGFDLQMTSDLNGPDWVPAGTPIVSNGQNRVILPVSAVQAFFRLNAR